jgi:aspartyl-tRNA synthetase
MVFLNLRQRIDSVQALLTVTEGKVSKQMVKWATSLADESIVLVEGMVRKTPELIKSATVGDVEVHVTKVSSLQAKLLCGAYCGFPKW